MTTSICHESDLVDGQARGFWPDEDGQDHFFIVRHEEKLYAWRNACPHVKGAPMAWKRNAYLSPDGKLVMCHAHGARFEPDSGLCVHGPCKGQSLECVPLSVDEAGLVRLVVR
jgi:nitrite reductase/ring-hydroxylating ferredoxin subunit